MSESDNRDGVADKPNGLSEGPASVATGRAVLPVQQPRNMAMQLGTLSGFVVFGACCGFFLLVVAIGASIVDPTMSQFRWPMIAVALAIIMGAVGAEVTANLKWVTAAGAAAMVLIFAKLFAPPPPITEYVYVYLHGTEPFTELSVGTEDRVLLSGKTVSGGLFHFIAKRPDLTGRRLFIKFLNAEGHEPRYVTLRCIDFSVLSSISAQDGVIGVSIANISDNDKIPKWVLRNLRGDVLADASNMDCLNKNRPNLNIASYLNSFGEMLVGQAKADSAPSIRPLLNDLKNPSLDSQVRAQNSIGRLRNYSDIADLINLWTIDQSNTRFESTLIAGLVDSIRRDRAVAVGVANAVNRNHMLRLIELAGATDRDLRYNSTELMSWLLQSLAWPAGSAERQRQVIVETINFPFRSTEEFYKTATNKNLNDLRNSLFNSIVALKDANCDMRNDSRAYTFESMRMFLGSSFVQSDDLRLTRDSAASLLSAICASK